jgi:hypothetical protein
MMITQSTSLGDSFGKLGRVADGCPKRRFWKSERTFGNAFPKYFSNGEYSIWLRSFEKYFGNAFPNVRSDFQNLRLGQHKLVTHVANTNCAISRPPT